VGDLRNGYLIVRHRVQAALSPRRVKILSGVIALTAGCTAAVAYLLGRLAPEGSSASFVYLGVVVTIAFASVAAIACLAAFVRVRALGGGPRGTFTPESEKELLAARREGRRPALSPSQQDFAIKHAAHLRKALTPPTVLQLAAAPGLIGLLLLLPFSGGSFSVWATTAILLFNIGFAVHALKLIGRTTLWLPDPTSLEIR